jgi:hypothetical protein
MASAACIDKTSTLTWIVMSVVSGLIGIHANIVPKLEDKPGLNSAHPVQRSRRRQFHCLWGCRKGHIRVRVLGEAERKQRC